MDNILKFTYQIFLIVLLITVFFGLLASPIIYINLKQKYYFKKLSNKLHLKIDYGTNKIRRNLPKIFGEFKNTKVYIQAGILGKYSYNTHYNTHKYASPVVKISVEINNPNIKKFKIIQKQEFETKFNSNFDSDFKIEIESLEKQRVFLNNSIKQKIVNHTQKHPYFNVELINGNLISIVNYELTNEKKYLSALNQFLLLMDIHKELQKQNK